MKTEDKKSFVFNSQWYEVLKEYPAEVRLEVYEAVIRYAVSGTLPDLKPLGKMAFAFIKKDLDAQLEKTRSGRYHWNWKGGVSSEAHRLRNSRAYRQWRTDVFKRDCYTCRKCGQHGGKLNAHHVIAFSVCPELRFDVSNGIALCNKCHVELHKQIRPWVKRAF